MGVGLAQACAYYGLRFICVIDPKTTTQNMTLLKAYGAEVDMVLEPDETTGEYLQARLNRVKSLLGSMKNTFWPNQYSHRYNPIAHHQTMHEIVTELNGEVDFFFCATSTCGTIRGCAEYVQRHKLATRIFAVDAVGSVIFGGVNAKRLLPGHGSAMRPALYHPYLAERCIHVTDLECVLGCRRLVRHEAILAGGSSGAVLMAVERVKDEIPRDATCAVIFADRGERYLDTIYSDTWVNQHFGDIEHLLQNQRETAVCLAMTN
jgi:cysteine synthase A